MSTSNNDQYSVLVHSSADSSKLEPLRKRLLEEHRIQVATAAGMSELSALLVGSVWRCIVYLSSHPLDVHFRSAVVEFAEKRGRDAVVIVLDSGLEKPTEEWAQFLSLRHADDLLEGLCRILATTVPSPFVHSLPSGVGPTGYADAFRYYHGFVRIVVRNFHMQLKKLPPDVYDSCAKKLLIVCPEDCVCPPTMEVVNVIEFPDMHITRNLTRAGQLHRDYGVTVYRIKDHESHYYFPGTFAMSLVTLADICKSGLAGVKRVHWSIESKRFFLHLEQLLAQSQSTEFEGLHRLLYWRNNVETLDSFLLPIVKDELQISQHPREVNRVPADPDCVDPPDVNCGNLYHPNAYRVHSFPKGICLIINITKFSTPTAPDDSDDVPLPDRTGTEPDETRLQRVFHKWLKFEVDMRRNLNEFEFLNTLDDIRGRDHSQYDVFVCCIMSHGCLGHVFTADRRRVRILKDIIEPFARVETLHGKPKIFFIQSCQVCSPKDGCFAGQNEPSDAGECFPTQRPTTDTSAVESDADKCPPADTQNTNALLPNELPDVFVSYSALPGSSSYRDTEKGTFYVQALAEELQKGGDLKDVLKLVAGRVKEKAKEKAREYQAEVLQTPFFHIPSDAKSVFLCGKAQANQ